MATNLWRRDDRLLRWQLLTTLVCAVALVAEGAAAQAAVDAKAAFETDYAEYLEVRDSQQVSDEVKQEEWRKICATWKVHPRSARPGELFWVDEGVLDESAAQRATRLQQERMEQMRGRVRNARKQSPFVNSLGMPFVPVPGTQLLFCIWETRVKDYQAFASATGRSWKEQDFMQGPTHPAVNVSWEDAESFCEWLSQQEGVKYRLPTDEEWSWAVGIGNRESGTTPKEKHLKLRGVYPWGTGWPPAAGAGNYDPSLKTDAYAKTSPVGSFRPNILGIYDLGGNVWEWCEDWCDENQAYRVLRGGSWSRSDPWSLLSSYRDMGAPGSHVGSYGFRCVMEVGTSP